jgi:hypothetical protein
MSIAGANRPFQFDERSQLFIGTHYETLSVAMRVSNPDYSFLGINGRRRRLRAS